MTIRLSPLPSPRRILPALALAVGVGAIAASFAFRAEPISHDASAFTGRYEHGMPVFRLAPVAVTGVRAASGVDVAARGTARSTPHVDAASAGCTASTS